MCPAPGTSRRSLPGICSWNHLAWLSWSTIRSLVPAMIVTGICRSPTRSAMPTTAGTIVTASWDSARICPALGLLGAAHIAVDLFDLDALPTDGPADSFLTLAGLLAQRDFFDHASLLGNHRLFLGLGHLDRALLEGLVGFFRLDGPIDAAALDIDVLFAQRDGLLDLALADLGLQALAAGRRGLADFQLLLDHLGLLGLLLAALALAAGPLQQGFRGQHLELAQGFQHRVSPVVLDLGDDQGAALLQRLGVLLRLGFIIAGLDQPAGDLLGTGGREDIDRILTDAAFGHLSDCLVGNVLGFEQSDDGSRHGKFLSNVFEPERPGTDEHPSRTCSQTCCIANRSKETSGRHGKNADKEAILIIYRPWKGKISYMEPSSYPNLAQHLLLKLVSGIQRLYAS